MTTLRFFGIVAAFVVLFLAARAYERRQISRKSLLIVFVLVLATAILAIRPSIYGPLFRWFNIAPGNERQLIFIVVLAVIVLFGLLVRVQSASDSSERAIRMLVEALGRERFDWGRAATLPSGRRLAVVLPAFNEERNIGAVLRSLPRQLGDITVVPIVVSDGSTDRTASEAREAGALATELPINRGGGLALRVGYELALQLEAEIVVTMDADGQHLPSELPTMIAPILDGEADYVNGSRLLGTFEKESTIRHIGVHVFSRVVTVLTGRRITDPSSGYRAARADLLEQLVLEQDQFWTSEILIEALRQRARVVEVPITIAARSSGASKKPKSLRYGWNFSKVIIQTWLR
jgi:hypothetical protein